jgi:hypothetical protein
MDEACRLYIARGREYADFGLLRSPRRESIVLRPNPNVSSPDLPIPLYT